jgi:hypothetical protein
LLLLLVLSAFWPSGYCPHHDRKLDIFLTPADAAPLDGEHDWSNVLVIGEHRQNPDEDRSTKTIVQLAGYAREVYLTCPSPGDPVTY